MKFKSSPLSLKIVILIAALIGSGTVGWNLLHSFRTGFRFRVGLPSGLAIVFAQYVIMIGLYLVIAVTLFQLASVGRNKEIISRKNLARVKRIQYILLALLFVKVVIVLMMTAVFMGSALGLALQLLGIISSSWELLVGMLIIYILAKVFEKAVILKEEEALTI
ncbi:DUF2975 domain-containing protein [Chitinophaga sp.]|uniref:DUF2975 domain-containing protein n=1 Tax=Chitinophaga sp. TaxID=1869181 RepID=UPI002F945CF0